MDRLKCAVLGLLLLCTGAAMSAPILGSLSSSNGLTATGPWAGGDFALFYEVNDRADGTWEYRYSLLATRKDISHFIIEVSDSFRRANVLSVVSSSGSWELGLWGDDGNSNPGIPENIYGLKFPADGLFDAVLLVSDRAPMWGSFYAKDGTDGGDDVFAFNTSFGLRSDLSAFGSAPAGFLLVPDTVSVIPGPSPAPEPGVLALLFGGFVAFWGMSAWRRNQLVKVA